MSEPLLVDVELGGTLPFGKESYGNVRPLVRINNVDVNGDLDEQIKRGLAGAWKVMLALDTELEATVTQMLLPVAGQASFSQRVVKLENDDAKNKANIKTLHSKVLELIAKVDGETVAAVVTEKKGKKGASGAEVSTEG